ncbi:hypothetical protein [Cohnella hongkongensis]|uniref:YCII-related domain-containing protein n=1 Tax=Cohnella hongkongensis TaxID=178337 RepID=A0ABV9F8B0_9BACL
MIVFCEYVVPAENRDRFLKWADAHPELWKDAELAENTAQPGVFVEIRRAGTEDEAMRTAKERREGRSWKEMEQWVKGGPDGLRVWTFRQRPLPKGSV